MPKGHPGFEACAARLSCSNPSLAGLDESWELSAEAVLHARLSW